MEISAKDRAIVESLVNPSDPQQNTYQHDFKLSQKILGMLISDKHFLVQCIDLIKPEYFEDEGHKLICSVVFDFFRQYKQLPTKVFIENEIRERRKNSEHIYQYLGELEAVIADYVPGMDSREYLMDKIVEFAKEQAARCAISRTMDVLKKKPEGSWNKIWELWREALTTDKGHDIGLDYFPTLEERYDRLGDVDKQRNEIFSSGFVNHGDGRIGIDGLLTAGGLCRGELGAYVGLSGSGKSIALVNAAVQNLLGGFSFGLGKKVCYITLEMNEEKIAKRFDALLSNEPLQTLADNKKMVIDAIRKNFQHETDKRRLIIKHYPGGTADINTFRAYLSQLGLYGFKPDLLVVDYIGELRDIPGMKTYESRQTLVRDMRTLAQEEKICILTAIQANRAGKEKQEYAGSIDDAEIADSFGQLRPLDAAWSINKEEIASNLGWIYIMKHRDGISKGRLWYAMDTSTLKMQEITNEQYKERIAFFRKPKANEVDNVLPKMEVE